MVDMANPTIFTQLAALFGKAEQQMHDHAQAAKDHTARHVQERDAERSNKTVTERPTANPH